MYALCMGGIRNQFGPVMRDITVNTLINGKAIPRALRGRLLNIVGHEIHSNARICSDVFLGATSGLSVGAKTFINYGCFFDLGASTTIGERCAIGYQVMFVNCSHEGTPESRVGAQTRSPITVGDGVWIGARATILPGVTVADGCVIAAGAVVSGDCERNGLYAGVPARRIKDLSALG